MGEVLIANVHFLILCANNQLTYYRISGAFESSVIMPFCAAFGCNSRYKNVNDSGVSVFRFPKDAVRRKVQTIYCRREDFSPTDNNCLCSLHFSKEQLDRDLEKQKEYGYAEPRIRLQKDGFPDIPLSVGKTQDKKCIDFLPTKKAKRS